MNKLSKDNGGDTLATNKLKKNNGK